MPEPTQSAGPALPTIEDHRLFPRRRARGAAGYRLADKPLAPLARVTLVDISQDGVCIVVGSELPVGRRIILELQASTGAPLVVEAEVCWSAPDSSPNQFRVGCNWSNRLSYADLQRFS